MDFGKRTERIVILFAVTMGLASAATAQRMLGSGRKMVIESPGKLEFFRLPKGYEVVEHSTYMFEVRKDGKRVAPKGLKPHKTLSFKRGFNVLTASPPSDNLLVCTDMFGGSYPGGELADFCGVVSLDGKVVFKFPLDQKVPDQLLWPIGFDPDGKYASVILGSEVEGEDRPAVGDTREVWTWEYPDKFKKYPGHFNREEIFLKFKTKPKAAP